MKNNLFYWKKETLSKNKIEKVDVFFANGEFFEIKKEELVDISITYSDCVVRFQKNVCPVVAFGKVKIKLQDKNKTNQYSAFANDYKQYLNNRKNYIESKVVSGEIVKHISVFDRQYCHKTLIGDIVAKLEEDFLIFEFVNTKQLPFSKKQSTITLNDVKKSKVESILLDFENCETCKIYNEEIIDINLEFDNKLVYAGGDYSRCIVGGYIKIKPQNLNYRSVEFFSGSDKAKITRRLCGEKGVFHHDICRLYVEYTHAGYGYIMEEVIETKEIVDPQYTKHYVYISGYAEKQKDGTILISFDENQYNIKREYFY